MLNKIKNLFVGEEGQGMTEYGLVLGAIAIGAVVALVALRTQITNLFNGIVTSLTGGVKSILP